MLDTPWGAGRWGALGDGDDLLFADFVGNRHKWRGREDGPGGDVDFGDEWEAIAPRGREPEAGGSRQRRGPSLVVVVRRSQVLAR